MLKNILKPHADAGIAVYAIWFNMFPGDSRKQWRKGLLDDVRVTHYWDEDKSVGGWFKQHVWPEAPGGSVIWDAWFLFGPKATWDETPAPLHDKGRTIMRTREKLRDMTLPLLPKE